MFYSQFILAKKGPLGTIWIAAHLERKLRKNQVADTDIGVSVDSILFPEVPIALRLSSHLLLGVVRIYSRKVNYLFNDCSEALLKIKQAFRSTAVDLPPEESTAPYHSITLPETFDLDDFELPDSALLTGNFVDHHVSTREQITLQDTLDGTGYTTSHFGLDERFGDGDASQIGLDLDEELFMGNNFQHASVPLASEEGLVHQGDVTAHHYSMNIDQNQYGHGGNKQANTSNDLSEVLGNDRGKHVSNIDVDRNDESSHRHLFNIQTPDLNEVFLSDDHIGGPSAVLNAMDTDFAAADPPSPEFIESSHAPSTPGLMDEAIPPNVQEFSAMNPREKTSFSVNFEGNNMDTSITQDFGCPDAVISDNLMHAVSTHPELANLAQTASPTSVTEPKCDTVAPEWPIKILNAPDAENDNGNIHKLSTEPDSINISQVSPSSALLSTEPIRDSLAPQCSVGVSPDATVGCNVIHPESSTLDFAEPLRDSLAPHGCSGDTAAADVTCAESTPKSTGSLPTVLIHNEMSHLPTSDKEYIEGETNLPEMVPFDSLISSNTPIDMVPGLISDINCNSFKDTTGTPNTGNLSHDKDAASSTFNSETFHLRSCSSQLNQANVLSLEDTVSARNTPEISFREPWSSVELQLRGEYPLPANVTDTDPGLLQKSTCVSSERNSGVTNPPSISSHYIPKDSQLDPWNCVASAQFPEPERMLLAPTDYANLTNDLGQDTAEKGITESDGSVDRFSNLRGQKRQLLKNTPVLQNGASPQASGMSQKRRYNEYIPADDDLLASILVGRRTPALTMGPTPPLPKTNYLKRPRLTSRVGLSKRRKILLDDTMVLHADAIRQQLINTEDIRRLRKKAPCTRPEIWRIQKSLLEDEIFHETIFTDISADLNSLLSRRYDLDQNVHSQINGNNSSILKSNDMELSRSSEIVRETSEREMLVHSSAMLDRVDVQEHSATTTLLDAQNCENATAVDARLASALPSDQTQLLRNNETATVSSAEAYVHESAGTELVVNSPYSENACEVPTDSIVSKEHHDGCFNPDQPLLNGDSLLQIEDTTIDAKPASIVVEHMGVDMVDVVSSGHPHDGDANASKVEEFEALLDSSMHEVQADKPADSSTVTVHTKDSIPDVIIGSDLPPDMTTTTDYQIETSEGGEVTVGEAPIMEKVLVDDERPTSGVVCAEKHDAASYPLLFATETECVPSAVGENSCMQDFNLDGGLVVESSPMAIAAATRESSDFCSAIDDLDTEFLNVDDGIDHEEEADNDAPNPDETQLLEKSGWSSRTRGVARYLKTMFDEECGRGRKSVAVDHLIAGKTRKEASRMFFETLVLKTRDYIHVEQDNPFGYVTIKPRSKLLKSEF